MSHIEESYLFLDRLKWISLERLPSAINNLSAKSTVMTYFTLGKLCRLSCGGPVRAKIVRVSSLSPDTTGSPVKPKYRGVSHQGAFFVFIALGIYLQFDVNGLSNHLITLVYSICVTGMFGVSALFHRHTWSPKARRLMRRADHSMIFLAVAGTYTPVAFLALSPFSRNLILALVWGGAIGGIVMKLLWIDAAKWLTAVIYVALGWAAVGILPQLLHNGGGLAFSLLVTGGILYTIGAVVYAFKRPDPSPTIFGYHEIFHALVIAAALCHFGLVLVLVNK
nr:hemolysin III family protein [Acidithrix ferrooxidans]